MTQTERNLLLFGGVLGMAGVQIWVFSDAAGAWASFWGPLLTVLGPLIFLGEAVEVLAHRLNKIIEATSGQSATVQQMRGQLGG